MKIYHYTDLNGLKGIIESGSLWATHFSFLNDSNELIHGLKCLENTINHLEDEFPPEILKYIRVSLAHFKEHRSPHVYNISFCLQPDLLSQWRGYGNAQGICLEFDDTELLQNLELEQYLVFSNSVIYTKEDSTIEAREKILDFFRCLTEKVSPEANELFRMSMAAKLVYSLPPFFKNDGFEEEKEFRIAIIQDQPLDKTQFRINANGLVPYKVVRAIGQLPLEGIKIGPCRNPAMMKEGISMLLESQGYKNIPITITETPLRG